MKRKLKRYQQAGLVAVINPRTGQIRHAKSGDMLDLSVTQELARDAFGSRASAETLVASVPALAVVNPLQLLDHVQ